MVRVRDFGSAIGAAFVVLTERIRKKFALAPSTDGPPLVNEVGSKSTLMPGLDPGERQAIRDYLSGAYGSLRNNYADCNPPTDLVDLEAALASVNLGLKLLG